MRNREICARRLWQRASLSIWAPLGNLEVGSFAGDAERQLNVGFGNGVSLPMELCEGKLKDELLYWEI